MSVQELAHILTMQYLEFHGSDKGPEELTAMYDEIYGKILTYIQNHPESHWTF